MCQREGQAGARHAVVADAGPNHAISRRKRAALAHNALVVRLRYRHPAMSLRFKLLIVALSTLVLPWVGWQLVRQVDGLLRQGQEQALMATATTLARALTSLPIEALPDGESVPVARIEAPIRVDGYADDWSSVRRPSAATAPTMQLSLADDRVGLYALVQVRDATRQRADPRAPQLRHADHVELGLEIAGRQRIYRLASAAPGSFEADADGTDGADEAALSELPRQLRGEWQEDGSGYRIELRLPRALLSGRIAWRQHDGASNAISPQPLEWRSVIGARPATERALARLAPADVRLRLLSADAVVLADAGGLANPAADHADPRSGLSRLLYRALVADTLNGSAVLDGRAARLDASEIWQALSGVAAASWRSDASGEHTVLAVAAPLLEHGDVRAALVLEQASRSVPLLTHRALIGLGVASLAALGIAGGTLLLFGALLSFRIRRLRNAVEQARRNGGRLGGPMPLVDDKDELGDLARSFQRLGDEVAAWTDYLRSLASRLSHELNTPLAIVKSSLDNLDQPISADAARGYLDRARDGADRLSAIVRAMSESNRIERSIAAADAEDVDLVQIVVGCAESYRALAPDRDVQVRVPSTSRPFHGAPELIAQALDKLFDNARTFTPVGGWIRISLLDADASNEALVSIRFANQGPPLPLAMQERLFDTLVSVRERSSRAGGEVPHLGLGLYVVKLVAELHRGSASAHNLASGDGVEFVLDLRGMPRRRLTDAAGE